MATFLGLEVRLLKQVRFSRFQGPIYFIYLFDLFNTLFMVE